MPENKPLIKLGQINFINCLPVNLPLRQFFAGNSQNYLNLSIDLTEGVPSLLNRSLRINHLDLAPISSFEYLSNKSFYKPVPGLSISSLRQADSVLLFVKENLSISEIDEIYITDKSASSVNLLKILLQDAWGLNLEKIKFIVFQDDPADFKAKLLIGDEALCQTIKLKNTRVIDLGTAWHEYSGLPMVFGLWTFNINSDVYKNSELRDFIIEFLNRSRDQGLSDLFPDVIVEAFKATGLPKSILLNYFKNLNYQFTDNHQQGLDYFEKKLKDLKLLGEFSCK